MPFPTFSGLMPKTKRIFNGAGRGGPNRMIIIVLAGTGMVGAVIVASSMHEEISPGSIVTKPQAINPTPGGLNSDPAQESLRIKTGLEAAAKAHETGLSYTPALAASRPASQPDPAPDVSFIEVVPPPPDKPKPVPHQRITPPEPAPVREEARQEFQPLPPQAHIEKVAMRTPQEQQALNQAVAQLLKTWAGRPPRTDIILTEEDLQKQAAQKQAADKGLAVAVHSRPANQVQPAGVSATKQKPKVLVPPGRMIYAHTVTAADSDTNGPVILEADGGPLAGDRMIGSFGKSQSTRLILRVEKIIHNGEELPVSGLVVAPDTMETSVASDVDQRYIERVLLPGAAAFVEGLGQAIAMSNTTTQSTALGSVNAWTKLNFPQQVGVGAGMAANRLGNMLTQQAPNGPRVTLGAHLPIAVMFLTPVAEKASTL